MAPPRLPQVFVERLIGVLSAAAAVAAHGAVGRQEFVTQIHADTHRISGFDPRQPPQRFATYLLGTAANLVPAYDGPRQGWSALGEILAVLLTDSAIGDEDKAWIAALAVRYRLIPWEQPNAGVPPAVQARLATVPPQPPPYWEGGMFPAAVQRGWHLEGLQQARAEGAWERVLSLGQILDADLAVPELAAQVREELATQGIDLPALIRQAQEARAQQGD
jgi:hypothetical protein